jgi:hypothetical protein
MVRLMDTSFFLSEVNEQRFLVRFSNTKNVIIEVNGYYGFMLK